MAIFKSVSWDDVRHRPFKKMTGQRVVVAHTGPRGRSPATRPQTPATHFQTQDAPPGPGQDHSPTRRKEDASKTSTFDVWCRVLMVLLLYTVSDKKGVAGAAWLECRLSQACESGLNRSDRARMREFAQKLRKTEQEKEDLARDMATMLNDDANAENNMLLLFRTLIMAVILAVVLRVYLL